MSYSFRDPKWQALANASTTKCKTNLTPEECLFHCNVTESKQDKTRNLQR